MSVLAMSITMKPYWKRRGRWEWKCFGPRPKCVSGQISFSFVEIDPIYRRNGVSTPIVFCNEVNIASPWSHPHHKILESGGSDLSGTPNSASPPHHPTPISETPLGKTHPHPVSPPSSVHPIYTTSRKTTLHQFNIQHISKLI